MKIDPCSDVGGILILPFQACLHTGQVDQAQHLAPVQLVILFYGIGGITDRRLHKLHLFDAILDQLVLLLERIFHHMIVCSIDRHLADIVQRETKIF